MDTQAYVTGTCDVQMWDVWFTWCQYFWTEIRQLIRVTVWTLPPTQTAWYQYAAAANGATSLDTRYDQSLLNYLSEIGRFRFTFQSSAYNTHCTPPINSESIEKSVDVVSCLPTWAKDNNGNLPRFPSDGTPIRVIYPANIDIAVRAVLTGWTTKFAQWGLSNVRFEPSTGGCAVIDEYCIEIGSKILPVPVDCGSFQGFPGPDSEYTNKSLVWLPIGYDNWGLEFQKWVIAHEIGHLLGLNHANACDIGTSVMKVAACNAAVGSNAVLPTDSDAMAVVDAAYNFGPQKTCGW